MLLTRMCLEQWNSSEFRDNITEQDYHDPHAINCINEKDINQIVAATKKLGEAKIIV